MPWRFNPFTGNLDLVDTTAAAGSNTQVQFNDSGSLAGDADFTWNKTTNVMTVAGDVNLNDGGSFTTTVQCVTPTANRTISFPDATGTVALVAGSSGQLVYNNAGSNAGATGSVVDSSGNVTIGGLTTLAGSPSANNTSGVLINGTWRTGASSNNPQLLLNPSGTTLSTTWSTSGTGIGVNAASGFAGNLLDLQLNGSNRYAFRADGTSFFRGDQYWTNSSASTNYGRFDATGLTLTSTTGISWGNTTNVTGMDVGLARVSAGVVKVTNGSTGDGTISGQLRAVGTAPAATGSTGTAGDIRYDTDYIYVCTATNTWKRAALATW